jgi:hypothetical protein
MNWRAIGSATSGGLVWASPDVCHSHRPTREVSGHPDGIELFLPWRKNDRDARGIRLWLPRTKRTSVRGDARVNFFLPGAQRRR